MPTFPRYSFFTVLRSATSVTKHLRRPGRFIRPQDYSVDTGTYGRRKGQNPFLKPLNFFLFFLHRLISSSESERLQNSKEVDSMTSSLREKNWEEQFRALKKHSTLLVFLNTEEQHELLLEGGQNLANIFLNQRVWRASTTCQNLLITPLLKNNCSFLPWKRLYTR